ncbi:acyl-CoA Delta(11) desaturase [Phthorimaea operculella]|nr:acyl-CoA Delta(11) desaturase [Phthorimaea operculella]
MQKGKMVQISEPEAATQSSAEEVSKLSKSRESNWPVVLFFIHIHLLSLYGIWLLLFEAKLLTILFLIGITSFAILGVTTGAHRLWAHRTYKASTGLKLFLAACQTLAGQTALTCTVTTGAHRLWAHRTYKASTGLRLFLATCQTLAGQGSIYDWVRHHRLHHEQFNTENDPYDHRGGFAYAHVLSRMRKLSPLQSHLLEKVDMSDLEADSIVMWQHRLYWALYGVFFLLLPLNAPLEYWDDTVLVSLFVVGFLRLYWALYVVFFLLLPLNAPLEYWDDTVLVTLFVVGFLRYLIVLHAAWLVDSGIALWGLQAGEKLARSKCHCRLLAEYTKYSSSTVILAYVWRILRLYWTLFGVFFLLLPLNAPLEYWDDTVLVSLFVVGFLRYLIVLHAAWLVDSGIALWGLQAGEK